MRKLVQGSVPSKWVHGQIFAVQGQTKDLSRNRRPYIEALRGVECLRTLRHFFRSKRSTFSLYLVAIAMLPSLLPAHLLAGLGIWPGSESYRATWAAVLSRCHDCTVSASRSGDNGQMSESDSSLLQSGDSTCMKRILVRILSSLTRKYMANISNFMCSW